jgi:DGQHR domain-containing protein
MSTTPLLRVPALRIEQSPNVFLYLFGLDGRRVWDFATVSRLNRPDGHALAGYQRPAILSHIGQIQRYIDSSAPLVPNAVVIAFNDTVKFEPAGTAAGVSVVGTLVIPADPSTPDARKPGWIVDGQQRLSAVKGSQREAFPLAMVGFIAEHEDQQREQFVLVNNVKPLPKGLIYELLPTIHGELPPLLNKRKLPAYLMDRLNRDDDSPLKGQIQTQTNSYSPGVRGRGARSEPPKGVIKDTSVLKWLEQSLSDGVMFDMNGDIEEMLRVAKRFYAAVAKVFKGAWGLRPRESRLTHGVGVVSLGFLMETICAHLGSRCPTVAQFEAELRKVVPICRWTDGVWDFAMPRKWNELQNTGTDIQLLASYLNVNYRATVRQVGPMRSAKAS